MEKKNGAHHIKEEVKKHYRNAIFSIPGRSCGCQSEPAGKYSSMAGYTPQQLQSLPQDISIPSFGCGNPVNFIEVKEKETVVDLGCGPGLDMFLAANKVGPKGKVVGIDMTPEMIQKAQENIKKSGAKNIEVRLGEMENLPVADNSVDWIISNCVINLSPDKQKVFSEICRVLKPGGRMMVSDIITTENLPEEIRNNVRAWVGCLAGAIPETEYLKTAVESGLSEVEVVGRSLYDRSQLSSFELGCCSDGGECIPSILVDQLAGKIASVRVKARKPVK